MAEDLLDRIAEYYDALHEDVDYAAECALLEATFARVLRRRPASVLDLGCGTGSHALVLAARGYEVTGIDASAGMLRVLSILLAAAPVLSGQLIVAAVALALAVFVLVAGSGFSAAYREVRHRGDRPRA